MDVQIKINEYRDDVYCNYCKNKIHLGDKYIVVNEKIYSDEIIEKPHHLDCLQETEDEELYIGDSE